MKNMYIVDSVENPQYFWDQYYTLRGIQRFKKAGGIFAVREYYYEDNKERIQSIERLVGKVFYIDGAEDWNEDDFIWMQDKNEDSQISDKISIFCLIKRDKVNWEEKQYLHAMIDRALGEVQTKLFDINPTVYQVIKGEASKGTIYASKYDIIEVDIFGLKELVLEGHFDDGLIVVNRSHFMALGMMAKYGNGNINFIKTNRYLKIEC